MSGDDQRDTSVRELRVVKPRLRQDLRFSFQEYRGVKCCMIEDPVASKFHRVGMPEYLLLSFFDGKRTLAEAHARASLVSGADALGGQEAVSLLSWLVNNHLADFGGGMPPALLDEQKVQQRKAGLVNIFNLLFIRLPGGNPDRFLEAASRRLGWLCHPLAFGVWLAVLAAGLFQVLWGWDRFALMSGGVLAPGNGLWMMGTWVVLKLIHEFGHGLVCRHYGCRVREAGVTLILFMPVTYVDATSSWALASKWRRMHVTAAGMWIELFVAALAALVWGGTEEGTLNTLAYNIVFMASVSTLLFNANPLMRFDGYYLLADFLEIPNLYTRSQAMLSQLARRYLMGEEGVEAPDWKSAEERWLVAYGIGSFVWRIVVMLSLLFAAVALFKGGGLILAIVSLLFWLAPIIRKVFAYLGSGAVARPKALPRLALLVAVPALLAFLPVHPRITGPALVQCGDLAILRAECPGFINRVLVEEGEKVKAGQKLVDMRNLEEQSGLEKLELKVRAQETKSFLQLGKQDVAAYQQEAASLEALRRQRDEKLARFETLDVRAPVDGQVIGWRLAQRVGTFLKAGDEIVRVGVLPADELKIAVSERDAEAFRSQAGHPVKVLVEGRLRAREAVLERVTARASREVSHPEWATTGGGPLPVVRRKEETGSREKGADYVFVDPVFEATARFKGEGLGDLRSGEIARVRFRSRNGVPLWKRGYGAVERFSRWLTQRASHGTEP